MGMRPVLIPPTAERWQPADHVVAEQQQPHRRSRRRAGRLDPVSRWRRLGRLLVSAGRGAMGGRPAATRLEGRPHELSGEGGKWRLGWGCSWRSRTGQGLGVQLATGACKDIRHGKKGRAEMMAACSRERGSYIHGERLQADHASVLTGLYGESRGHNGGLAEARHQLCAGGAPSSMRQRSSARRWAGGELICVRRVPITESAARPATLSV